MFNTSSVSNDGFALLLDALAAYAKSHLTGGEQALISRERHRHAAMRTGYGGAQMQYETRHAPSPP
jgi:hypothetical protein